MKPNHQRKTTMTKSKTHLMLTFREIDLIHFGTLRARAIDYASNGRRESARRVGKLARELWKTITAA